MIETRELVKVFPDRKGGAIRAVDGVSLAARPGSIFGLLGANGAGKTTTLRMIATLLTPTSGTAIVAGHDVRAEPQRVREKIGFLTGSTALYGRLTAREMVEYFGKLHGLNGAALGARVSEIFGDLEMNGFARSRCDKLSTGQKQRVSIARAIVHQPAVMVFDEPTTGLDVMTSRTIMRFIEKCRDEGRTVVFSTHIMSEAERLCDEVAVIHGGRIVAQGTLEALRERTGLRALESVFLKLVGEPGEETTP
ncbi:MAG: ATP-binding cassette domain-containing protein [Burkholderiales bacterium]|jgi:sodium transport system ATP-binding protein|nr:ATP-binding cassette domain-containing protein [Burkholderiales bacterium]